MRIDRALLLAAAFATLPVQGFAADKPIKDVKELAGSWQGWVTAEVGDERATMIVQEDGRYKAATTRGTTAEGQFYLKDGTLLYRSSRTAGTARLTEESGKITITIIPNDPSYRTGSARYERVKE
jgi:hypothetical protein